MQPVDTFKLKCVLLGIIDKLAFLDHINVQDDASSELAGYEISKLLSEQRKLESNYAELIHKRTELIGISNKRKFVEIQKKIQSVAKNLKESTKKFCRLFKENPDLEGDAIKVKKDRRELIETFEKDIITSILDNSYGQIQQKILNDLENQDLLRKKTVREKELSLEIKKLQLAKIMEQKDYQTEINEKQKSIQILKDILVDKTEQADVKKKYIDMEVKASVGTQKRINNLKEKDLQDEINRLKTKISTEDLVHAELVSYLKKKEEDIRAKSNKWNADNEKAADKIGNENEELRKKIKSAEEEYEKKKIEYEQNQMLKKEEEEKELKKLEEKRQIEIRQIKLENAMKLIQMEYAAWKEAGGGKKRRRKKKKTGKK